MFKIYCGNCGEKGHIIKDCKGAITSFGIIAINLFYLGDGDSTSIAVALSASIYALSNLIFGIRGKINNRYK